MVQHARELPGDILHKILCAQAIPTTAEFVRQHQNRVSQALERRVNVLSQEELDRLWKILAPTKDKWYNRFAIRWNSAPKGWRALCTMQDRDALIVAGWLEEGSDLDGRFTRAIELQDALRMGWTYQELEQQLAFERHDLLEVYNTLCWVFSDTARESQVLADLPFNRVSHIATRVAANTLQALDRLGIVQLPDGGLY